MGSEISLWLSLIVTHYHIMVFLLQHHKNLYISLYNTYLISLHSAELQVYGGNFRNIEFKVDHTMAVESGLWFHR